MSKIRQSFQSVVTKGQYSHQGIAENGSAYISRRMPIDAKGGTVWTDLFIFAPNAALLNLVPDKALLRGPVREAKRKIGDYETERVIYSTDVTKLEIFNNDTKQWALLVPDTLLPSKDEGKLKTRKAA